MTTAVRMNKKTHTTLWHVFSSRASPFRAFAHPAQKRTTFQSRKRERAGFFFYSLPRKSGASEHELQTQLDVSRLARAVDGSALHEIRVRIR